MVEVIRTVVGTRSRIQTDIGVLPLCLVHHLQSDPRSPPSPHLTTTSTSPRHSEPRTSRYQRAQAKSKPETMWERNSPTLRLPMTKIFLFNATLDVDSDMSGIGY